MGQFVAFVLTAVHNMGFTVIGTIASSPRKFSEITIP